MNTDYPAPLTPFQKTLYKIGTIILFLVLVITPIILFSIFSKNGSGTFGIMATLPFLIPMMLLGSLALFGILKISRCIQLIIGLFTGNPDSYKDPE